MQINRTCVLLALNCATPRGQRRSWGEEGFFVSKSWRGEEDRLAVESGRRRAHDARGQQREIRRR
jgi:hypothetical protein